MNRQIRVIESGFRASAAALGDWGKSAGGLELRIKALSQEMDLQQSKVKALQEEYERVSAEKGDTSRAAQDLQIKLNKETETLNKMGIELEESQKSLSEMGQESKEASNEVRDLGKSEDETRDKTEKFRSVMGGLGSALKVGVSAIAGLTAAVVGVGGAITKLVLDTADASGELVDMSLKTGLTTDKLQELAYAGGQIGTGSDTITDSLAKMTRSLITARKGTGDAADAFRALEVPIIDANGQLRDSQTIFNEAIDALGGVANETERDAMSMAIFGRSAMELNPLIKAGSAELARLSEEAHQVGAVMDEDAVSGMEAFGDTLDGLKAGLKGTLGTLATAFLPGFQNGANKLKDYLAQFAGIVKGSNGDFGQMAAGIGGLAAQIVSDISAQGPALLKSGLGILQGIVKGIVSNLPTLLPAVIEMLLTLVKFIIENLPSLITAAVQIIVTLANGIAQALPELIPAIALIIPQIALILLNNLPLLIEAALNLIIALASGLVAALPVLVTQIPKIVQAIFNAFIAALPMIYQAAIELIVTLVKGIISALPSLGEAAVQIVDVIAKGVADFYTTILDIGVGIVNGIWEGIQSQGYWLGQQIKSFFTGIVNSAKKALGIHSPSTVFAGIGENMAAGLGAGFAKQFRDIERQITGAVSNMQFGSSFTLAGTGAMPNLNMGGIHIYISGQADKEQVGLAARDGVLSGLRAAGVI